MRKSKRNKMLVITLIAIVYVMMKVYVLNTSTLNDDLIPDFLLQFIAMNDSD